MAMDVCNHRIERLVVLLDIKSIANRPRYLTLAIQHFVKTILQACTKDGLLVLWSFKVFDSSISPVSFRTRAEALFGNQATEVPFDSALSLEDAASNFVRFGEVLKSIHGLKGENASAPNVDFVVSAIQELLKDNTWEPLIHSCKRPEKTFPIEIRSNIVMLCSSFPKFQKQISEFFNTTGIEALSKIIPANFQSLRTKIELNNIRPFWVDTDTTGMNCYFDFAFHRRVSVVLQKIGWGIASLDNLSLGSVFIPHSLILSFISQFHLQKPEASAYGKLRLQVVDERKMQRTFLICKVGLVYMDNGAQKCSRFLQNDAKLRITVNALLPKCFVASATHTLECYLMRQHPSRRLDGRDNEALRDRVLEQFQSNIGDFEIGKPVIHLVLSSIARKECIALLHIEIVSSNRTLNLSGILEPFSLSSGILRFAENLEELLDLSFLHQKLQSVSEYSKNVRGKVTSRKRKTNGYRHLTSKVCANQVNQLYSLETTDYTVAWSSYVKFLELHDKLELDCPLLEEGYTSLTTKCMRVFKCWLHEEKIKLKSFLEGQTDDLIKVCQTLKFKEDAPTVKLEDKVSKVVLSINEGQCQDRPRTRYSVLCDSLAMGCSNYSIACSMADLPMPEDVSKLLKPFDRQKFGLYDGPLPVLGEPFSYWGNRYVIKDSTIPGAGRGLFILNDVKVGYGNSVALMIYGGPEYNSSEFEKLTYYSFRMIVYGCNSNARSLELAKNDDPRCRLYIDGRPEEHGNIAGLINSCGSNKSLINCLFEERENDCEEYMKQTCERFIMVMAIRSLSKGDELLLDYDICTDVPPQFVM